MPRGPKGEKRPADVIGNAVHVMRIATGEIPDNPAPEHARTHIVQSGTPTFPAATIEQILAETRKTYSGPLQAGEDLMSFDITDAGVRINPPPSR